MRSLLLFLTLLLPGLYAFSGRQNPAQTGGTHIRLYNPSFEDTPKASAVPAGWRSWTPGSTPDILPGAWGVTAPAHDGQSCIGLVTREDGTSEDISQVLSQSLQRDSCYTFSLQLSHSPSYVGYNLPIRLRIWGGGKPGQKQVLLASSPLVQHSDWKAYRFQFVPTADIKSITFEAWFAPGAMFRYRGNILLDSCSEIERCDRA